MKRLTYLILLFISAGSLWPVPVHVSNVDGTLISPPAYSLASDPSAVGDFDATEWRSDLNVADGAEANTVDSVNSLTGAVVLDPDDLDDTSTTNKFTTAGDIARLAAMEDNATADQTAGEIASAYATQVGQVSAGEITAGTETNLRTYSPANIVSFISQHESGAAAPTVTLTAGENVTAANAGYVKSDGKIWHTDASAAATSAGLIGIITSTEVTDDPVSIQYSGSYTTSGLTAGATYYLSETTGAITDTQPTTDGSVTRIIGYATSTTNLEISPDETWIENGPDTVTINDQTGTSYTLVISDASKRVRMDNGSANVLTVPLNSSVAFPTGSRVEVRQEGAGLTTIRGASGVTLNEVAEAGGNESDVDSQGQHKTMVLTKIGTDAWDVDGGA